jgi:hypothetical protein
MSIAKCVVEEVGCRLGQEVGYTILFLHLGAYMLIYTYRIRYA